jgi:MFS family permease
MSVQPTSELTVATLDRQTDRCFLAGIGGGGVLVLLAAAVAMAMGFGGLGLITVFMGPIEADLGWSRSDTSLAYALSTAGMAIGGLFWGRLSDRTDVRLLFALGGSGMVASLLAMSFVQFLPAFYLAHVVYGGFGFSVIYSPLLSTSGEWFPERRGLVMGLVTAGGALGQGLLPFFASYLIDAFGWRWAFVGLGCTFLIAFGLTLPILRWPQGTRAPVATSAGAANMARAEGTTVAFLALAAFLCCMCMGVPVVHMASFIGAVCGSPSVGVNSLLIAMIAGAIGRVCCGLIADRIGPLKSYAMASSIQTACVAAFPALGDSMSFMALSAIFGFGFAGNMTCLSLCVRQAVPANRFGGAIGIVMMVAWAGMALGGYLGGVLFDLSLSYTLSFLLAGMAGVLNLAALCALATTKNFPRARRSGKAAIPWPARNVPTPLFRIIPAITAMTSRVKRPMIKLSITAPKSGAS